MLKCLPRLSEIGKSGLRWLSDGNIPKVHALNHVAIAVPNLSEASALYRNVLGAEVSSPTELPEHGVRVAFVQLTNTKLELMEPLNAESPISNFLKRNPSGGVHHICLEVDDVKRSLHHVTQHIPALNKEPKIGAHGTPVAFLHPKGMTGVLVELEEVSEAQHSQ